MLPTAQISQGSVAAKKGNHCWVDSEQCATPATMLLAPKRASLTKLSVFKMEILEVCACLTDLFEFGEDEYTNALNTKTCQFLI